MRVVITINFTVITILWFFWHFMIMFAKLSTMILIYSQLRKQFLIHECCSTGRWGVHIFTLFISVNVKISIIHSLIFDNKDWYVLHRTYLPFQRKTFLFLEVHRNASHNMKSRNLSKKPATLRKNRDQCRNAIHWSDATFLPWKIIQLIGQKSYHFFLQNYAFGKCQQLKKEGRSTATT